MAKKKVLTINDIIKSEQPQEISKLTLSIRLVADKIDDGIELTRGEQNLAKNILREHAEKLQKQSLKASSQTKSDDPVKIKHREKVLRYRTKKSIERLTEGKA